MDPCRWLLRCGRACLRCGLALAEQVVQVQAVAVAIAVAFQWIFNFIVSSTFLPMYNMSAGEMGDKFGHMFVYGLYGAICILAALFVWRLVPETKGKTLEDMTRLWKEKQK